MLKQEVFVQTQAIGLLLLKKTHDNISQKGKYYLILKVIGEKYIGSLMGKNKEMPYGALFLEEI